MPSSKPRLSQQGCATSFCAVSKCQLSGRVYSLESVGMQSCHGSVGRNLLTCFLSLEFVRLSFTVGIMGQVSY